MADDKNLKGQQDRQRVAGDEPYEVNYLAQKHHVSAEVVKQAIEAVGNNREAIEAYLSKNGKA